MAPGVHEDVERGVGARELLAVQDAEEGRVRQQRPEPGLLGPAADEHEAHAREPVDVGQQLELLLRRQPADVPDEELAVRRELGVERPRRGCAGSNSSWSTPRGQRATRVRRRARSSCAMLAVDGASVRSTPRWIRRVSDSIARAPPGTPYRSAKPTRSVW